MFDHLLAEFYRTPWAILEERFATIETYLHLRAMGQMMAPAKAAELKKPQRVGSGDGAGVAVIPIMGTIAKRMNMMMAESGGASTDNIARALRAALADPSVHGIILHIDSPGGAVPGVPELWSEIMASRGGKKIVAVGDPQIASAAWWIASAADQIVLTPSGEVGSQGVFAAHRNMAKMYAEMGVETTIVSSDISPFKTEFSSLGPLNEAAHEELKRMVNMLGEQFVDSVANGRGVSVRKAKIEFGQGRMLEAARAMAAGMVDKVETMDSVVRRMLGKAARATGARADHLEAVDMVMDEEGATPVMDEQPIIISTASEENVAISATAEPPEDCPTGENGDVTTAPPAEIAAEAPQLDELRRRELDLKLAALGAHN